MILADPQGSILVDYETGKFGEAGSWIVEGIGEDFIPEIADFTNVKKVTPFPMRNHVLLLEKYFLKKEF